MKVALKKCLIDHKEINISLPNTFSEKCFVNEILREEEKNAKVVILQVETSGYSPELRKPNLKVALKTCLIDHNEINISFFLN